MIGRLVLFFLAISGSVYAQQTHHVVVTVNQSPSCDIVSVHNADPSVSIFPNPAKDLVNITTSSEETFIAINDQFGREILREKILKTGTTTVNLSGVARGIYHITVIAAGQKSNKKLIIR